MPPENHDAQPACDSHPATSSPSRCRKQSPVVSERRPGHTNNRRAQLREERLLISKQQEAAGSRPAPGACHREPPTTTLKQPSVRARQPFGTTDPAPRRAEPPERSSRAFVVPMTTATAASLG